MFLLGVDEQQTPQNGEQRSGMRRVRHLVEERGEHVGVRRDVQPVHFFSQLQGITLWMM